MYVRLTWEDVFCFQRYAVITINLPPETAFAASHRFFFLKLCFHLSESVF